MFVVEDADGQHRLQILQLDVLPPSPRPPEVKGRLRDEVPACVAEFAKGTRVKITYHDSSVSSRHASALKFLLNPGLINAGS